MQTSIPPSQRTSLAAFASQPSVSRFNWHVDTSTAARVCTAIGRRKFRSRLLRTQYPDLRNSRIPQQIPTDPDSRDSSGSVGTWSGFGRDWSGSVGIWSGFGRNYINIKNRQITSTVIILICQEQQFLQVSQIQWFQIEGRSICCSGKCTYENK